MDLQPEEIEQLRQDIQSLFGGRIRDLTIRQRDGGLVLGGRTGTFHVKQLVQEVIAEGNSRRIIANEIEVE